MSSNESTIDAYRKFNDILCELMDETGHDSTNYTADELKETMRVCCDDYMGAWDEYTAFVIYGGLRERTLAMLRAGSNPRPFL